MSTDPHRPSQPEPSARPARPRVVAGVAAVLAAAAATGVLIATAPDQGGPEPAVAAGSASRSVSAPAPGTAPPTTAPPTTAPPPTGGPPVTAPPVVAPPVTAPATGPTGTDLVPAPAGDDVDGDGRRDVVSLPATGTVRIRDGTGRTDTVAFDATAGRTRLLGIADADGDGRGEVFVRVDSGAYTDRAAAFRHVGGRLRLVTLGGEQAQLVSGASVRHSSSWACRPPRTPIVLWSGESDDGTVHRGTVDSYRFAGATLVRISSRPLTVDDLTRPPVDCRQIRT